ncbi:MAG: AAA family ATPase [Bacteroidetes bacterium]|nr:AAA family ATPase [Bacteroidota bacterium]
MCYRSCFGNQKGDVRNISLKINRGDNLSKIITNNKEDLRLIDEAIENAERNYFVVAYGASRKLSNDPYASFEKQRLGWRSVNVRSLFDNSVSLNPLTSWVMELDYRSGKEGIGIVKDALEDFLPGLTFLGIDKDKKQLIFKTPDGDTPLEQLSDGYQNMAAWIGDLLFRVTDTFKDYKNPLNARGLLLIDEIDLHLHPKWQRRLIDFIGKKLPNFQVVATTHSPLTAQQADEGELFALKRNELNLVELIPFSGSPKKLLVNQLLMSPVFGLETDESLELQQMKEEYHFLKSMEKNLNSKEKKKFEKVKAGLQENLPNRQAPASIQKQIELIERIEKKLNIK